MESNVIILCEICGRKVDKFLVCSIPGFGMSMNHCEYCLAIGAMPLFTAEVTMADENLDMLETIQKHGVDVVKSVAADWFLDSPFWIPPNDREEGPGRYMSLRAYLEYLAARL